MSHQNTAVSAIAVGDRNRLGAHWDALHNAASAPVFSSMDWLSLLSDHFNRSLTLVVQYSDAGAPEAGIPLCLSRKGPLVLSSPLPISLYSGLVSKNAAALSPTLLASVERACNFCVLQLPPDTDTDIFSQRGWSLLQQRSSAVQISDPDALWSGYSQSLRRKIRRARERRYQCTDDVSPEHMMFLYEQSYERHRLTPPLAPAQMKQWLVALLKLPMTKVYGVRCPDGGIPAFRVVLRDGTRTYDWLAGSENVHGYPAASHWLVHEVLQREAAGGSRSFDFMGMNTPGVRNFKELFGGQDVSYTVASWYRPSIVRGIESLRNQVTRLWREYR